MTENWLESFLGEAVRKRLCTRIFCTTCGAMEFRRGVLEAWARATGREPQRSHDRTTVMEISRALAGVNPPVEYAQQQEEAVRCLLFDLWSGVPLLDEEIEPVLAGTWAGNVLAAMQQHHAHKMAARRAQEEYDSPATIQMRREEKLRLKQEQLQQRLERKEELDRRWREEQEKKE